ncbi:ferredoxin [Clostridium sp. JN-9]|uniref:ferredoxin n=1 Tax=Clostridium sp. JN-9 TaxID=2507159 RepID=UPI000FFE2210|nr:ferredoxin [Clostridium sp. JN-9]QAT39616.1 ferredoxin [Clostridium sp. JN-9]
MKAFVDKDTCIGCGLCPTIESDVFSMDDDGKAVAIPEELKDDLISGAKEAEENCPVNAIHVE